MFLGLFIMFLSGLTTSEVYGSECDYCTLEAECYLLEDFLHRIPFSFYRYFYSNIHCGYEQYLPTVCCDEDFMNDVLHDLNAETINSYETIENDHSGIETDLNTLSINEHCEMKESRIIGGVTASFGLFPWMAKLGYTNGEHSKNRGVLNKDLVYRCGGTLVTLRHVITAAHCLVGLPDGRVLSVVELDADRDKLRRYPEKITSHPGYNSSRTSHDLGIIKLNRPVTLSNNVMPICLPFDQYFVNPAVLEKRSLIVAGWGTVRPESTTMSARLRYTRLNYMEVDKCRQLYWTRFRLVINDGHLCTEPDGRRDACYGDSGGPLFTWLGDGNGRSAVLIAVVSFGSNECAASDVPPVFTRIDTYMDWIMRNID